MKTLIFILILLLAGNVFGDSKTFQNTTNVEDTYLSSAATDANYGAATGEIVEDVAVKRALIKLLNLSDSLPANAKIDSCTLELYFEDVWAADSIFIYRALKSWWEGNNVSGGLSGTDSGSTWIRWQERRETGNEVWLEWTDPGAVCGDASGVDNDADNAVTCNADSADYKSVVIDSANITGTGYVLFHIDTALVQGWYNETIEPNGLIIVGDATAPTAVRFSSSESATQAQQPEWIVYYTVTGGETIITGIETSGVEW